jgi:hypothetical protein
MVADRNSLAAIHRIKGVKEETECRVAATGSPARRRDRGGGVSELSVSRAQLDAPLDLRRAQGRKRGRDEEEARGTFWRGTTIELESQLRIGRAIAKTEEEVALELMTQHKARGHSSPPAPTWPLRSALRNDNLWSMETIAFSMGEKIALVTAPMVQ